MTCRVEITLWNFRLKLTQVQRPSLTSQFQAGHLDPLPNTLAVFICPLLYMLPPPGADNARLPIGLRIDAAPVNSKPLGGFSQADRLWLSGKLQKLFANLDPILKSGS